MKAQPLLIVLTGINGSGKDTLAPLLVDWLNSLKGLPAQFVYAPRVTPAAAAFQDAVLVSQPKSKLAEMLGYYAQHAESDAHLAHLRHNPPQHLVINRGPETTLVYNAIANELTDEPLKIAHMVYDMLHEVLDPTLTVLLDVDLATARQRSTQQAVSDHIQERDDAYYKRMIVGYHELAATRPGWATVDATTPIPEVLKQIKAHIEPLLG